jgi:DNA-binding transcriptional regulator YdaS (Cro superfamily)
MPDVYIRTLARAAEIVGGATALAFRLKVTPSHLSLWMGGLEPCPANIFLQAVDLVLEREISAQRAPRAAERAELTDAVRGENRDEGKHDRT